MVFNMFRGLSRLLSRKSVKTAVPPVVELSHDDITSDTIVQSLNIAQHDTSKIVLTWVTKSGRYVSCYVDAPYTAFSRATFVRDSLQNGGLIVSKDYHNRQAAYLSADRATIRISQLLQMLCDDGILVCVAGTIVPEYRLSVGVVLM